MAEIIGNVCAHYARQVCLNFFLKHHHCNIMLKCVNALIKVWMQNYLLNLIIAIAAKLYEQFRWFFTIKENCSSLKISHEKVSLHSAYGSCYDKFLMNQDTRANRLLLIFVMNSRKDKVIGVIEALTICLQ